MGYRAFLFLLLFTAISILGCNKEGVGGKASISGTVKHLGTALPGAIVYIRYGADIFPGYDLNQYDDNATVNGVDASFSFGTLYKGNYYLYAVGYNSSIMETVTGGIAVKIKKKTESLTTEVLLVQ